MNVSYKLFQGPGRKDLLQAIDKKNVLHFRGRDETGHSHLFAVFVTGIDLMDMGRDDGTWNARGIIVTKNGLHLDPSKKFRANYNSQHRRGEFTEIAHIKDYSLEYFQQMNNGQLALEIEENRNHMPSEIRELEDFAGSLSNHERLALLAYHTHLLSDACIVPKLDYQLGASAKKIRAEQAHRPVHA